MRWLSRAFGGDARAPRDVGTALQSALLAALDADLDLTEVMLRRAAELDSGAVHVHLALARVFRARGEIGRAIRVHQNLLMRTDLDSAQHVLALTELAADFRRGGFLRRAIASYEEVLAGNRRHRVALRALVDLSAEVRDHTRALELCRRLARLERRDGSGEEAELYVAMAETARAEGRAEDARRAVKKALRRDRASVRAWIVLGSLERERGRNRAALAAWVRVPRLDRRSGPIVYPQLEATYAELDRAREYEVFLRELLADSADDAGARLALARTLAARGEVDDAVAELRHALDRDPDDLEARATLGRVLLAEHRDPEATVEYAVLLDVLDRRGTLRSREHQQ